MNALAGVRGAQRDQRLFGQRRIAVGLLRRGHEGFDVLQQLRVRGSFDGEHGPVLRVRRTHGARLYGAAGAGPILLIPERLRIVVNSSGVRLGDFVSRNRQPDARGIHHWGGLDTFDPYVLHSIPKKPRTQVRGFFVFLKAPVLVSESGAL